MVDIGGRVTAGYEGVQEAFLRNFEEHGEVGASVAAWVAGTEVVSLWGGVADAATGRPWEADTIVTVFSMTKGLSATCVSHLAQEGGIDLDAPVATYWPEFAANGKGAITVRMLLSHQAGLPTVDGTFTLDEALAWTPIVDALAAQTPRWGPGTKHGYHLRTFSWLVGETFRRAAGRTIGAYWHDEIAGPLGLDWHLPLPESEEPRVAMLVPPGDDHFAVVDSLPQDMLLVQAMGAPSMLFRYDAMWNDRRLRAAELPSTSSVGNAAAAAALYNALLGFGDTVVLRPETLADVTAMQASGPDETLLVETAYATGFMRPPTLPQAAGPSAFGHGGAGGSTSFADPAAGVAFAYTPNRLRFAAAPDRRSEALVAALYAALGA